MSGLNDFLEDLGTNPESSGCVTLNPERALQHMARWMLPGPHHTYLLKLVQAAVAAKATEIACKVGWLAIEIEFVPQRPLPLEKLLHSLFEQRQPALRHLAVGVNAALSAVRSVAIEQDGRRHVFAPGDCWEESAPSRDGVRIRISRTRWDSSAEVALLHERCCWSPVPISVNGRSVQIANWGSPRTLVQSYLPGVALSAPSTSRARRPPRVEPRFAGRRIPCRAVLALEPSLVTTVAFVQSGVLLCCREVDLGIPGLVAIVDGEGLPTDFSGFELVDGPALAERIESLRGEAVTMAERARIVTA